MKSDVAFSSANNGAIAGLMPVRGILGTVVSGLGKRVVSGEWQSGEALPTEAAAGSTPAMPATIQ